MSIVSNIYRYDAKFYCFENSSIKYQIYKL